MRRERPLNATATTTSDDIRQFRAAVAGVAGAGGPDALPAPDPDWRSSWTALTDLGVTALCVPEESGGLGFEVEVAAATAAEFGAALHGSPYAAMVAVVRALASNTAAGEPTERVEAALAGIISGDLIASFGRLDPSGSTARSVDGADGADLVVLEDSTTGALTLFDDPESWTTATSPAAFDVSRSCVDLTVDVSAGLPLGIDATAGHLFGLLLAADAFGGAERVLARTVTYAGDRQAFGSAIGGFQAVQHRLADHAVRLRGVGLQVREAARSLAGGRPDAARRVVLAEASVSSAVGPILHDLLQLTGAIGFTWEYGLHFFQRRAHQDARLAANPRLAHQALIEIEGWAS